MTCGAWTRLLPRTHRSRMCRQTIADRELESWLVVDLSPSIDFGTAFTEKRELVLAAITAVVHLSSRGGNRVGADRDDRRGELPNPARSGRSARPISDPQRAIAPGQFRRGEATWPRLSSSCAAAAAPPVGLVAIVSDFLDSSARRARTARSSAPTGSVRVVRAGWSPSRRRNRGRLTRGSWSFQRPG